MVKLPLQNTPDEVYKLMLECWNEDHIKRPTLAIIESKIEELLQSDRYICAYIYSVLLP